jgi:putative spermidine/putrescine transport system permease protein
MMRSIMLTAVVTPLLTSAVVRTYGWIALLGDQGIVPSIWRYMLPFGPPKLLYNMTGVIIGMTEILMPYMILALLVGFGRVDPKCEEAARTLGANPLRAFIAVVLPLSISGIALGCLFTFVHAASAFVTPRVLGGGRVNLLATEIYDQATMLLDWPAAGMVSIMILIIFGITLALYTRAVAKLD